MIHVFINLFVIPAGISYLYIIFLKKNDKLLRLVTTVFLIDMTMSLYYLIAKNNTILNMVVSAAYSSFYIKYVILSIVLSMITNKAIDFIKEKPKIKIYYFSTFFMAIAATIANIYFIWFLGTSGRMDFITFMYNITTPVNTNIVGFHDQLTNLLFFCTLMSGCIIYIFTKGNIFERLKHKERKNTRFANRIGKFAIPCLLLIYICYLPFYSFHLEDAYDSIFVDEDFPKVHYIDPNDVKLTWPTKKQNLIYLFVESYESSFFSKELGGLSKNNLLPNMSNLMQEGNSFSNNKDTFGGYQSMPHTDWTIGGMVTATSGILHKLSGEYRTDPDYCLVPGVTTLMDLLAEQGYNRKFITGTVSGEYNIGPYFKAHKVPVDDYNTFLEDGRIPADYKEWFGVEDSKLYEFAKNEITELSQKEEPFLYIMNTNDTHSPEGYIDKSCKNDFSLEAENSIACSDQMINEFVTWLKEQPYYDDTTVVIIGDHISHENKLTRTFTESDSENRRVFNLILNANSPVDTGSHYNREFWSADLFPTVLSALNVKIEGNKLGLGSNLFSNVPTLLEIYGSEEVRDLLTRNSSFYLEKYKLDPNKQK